ncbi:hypothetical protein D018_0750B, partial [Vibrio parahaemolyticus VP2007-007]
LLSSTTSREALSSPKGEDSRCHVGPAQITMASSTISIKSLSGSCLRQPRSPIVKALRKCSGRISFQLGLLSSRQRNHTKKNMGIKASNHNGRIK